MKTLNQKRGLPLVKQENLKSPFLPLISVTVALNVQKQHTGPSGKPSLLAGLHVTLGPKKAARNTIKT